MSSPSIQEARHYLVSGRVQRVGFRHYTKVQARDLGLQGTVENLADGRVEIYVAGAPALLDDFAARVASGPRASRVDEVRAEVLPAEDAAAQAERWVTFQVRR